MQMAADPEESDFTDPNTQAEFSEWVHFIS